MAARVDVVQGDFATRQGIDDDPGGAGDDEIDVLRIALAVDDLFLSGVGLPRTGLLQPLDLDRAQIFQQMYLRQ